MTYEQFDGFVGSLSLIPAAHVEAIYKRLAKGDDYIEASPMYPITREIAAFILTNYKPITKKKGGKRCR